MAVYGYARVSTADQSLDRQADALAAAGVPRGRVYAERVSGRSRRRPELERVLAAVRDGDTLVVASLDRLGRSTTDLIDIAAELSARGVQLVSLKESIDTSSATGRMFYRLLGALAEFERELIVERTREGLAAARARGRRGGRPRAPQGSVDKAMEMYETGEGTLADIARATGLSVSTVQREARRRGLSRRSARREEV